MGQTLTLREAGIRLGVSGKALKRLIRSGVLPEAHKVSSSSGRAWVIPADALPVIAERQGWIIDLTGEDPYLDVEDGQGKLDQADSNQATADNETGLANQEAPNKDLQTLIDPFDLSSGANPSSNHAIAEDGIANGGNAEDGGAAAEPVEAVQASAPKAELAPEYETIRLERLNPNGSLMNQPDPQASRMADVYDLNPTHTNNTHSTNGNSIHAAFDNDRTGTEDPSPNEMKFPGAKTAMNSKALNPNALNSTPISPENSEVDGSTDQIRAGQPPLPGQPNSADIDLSTGTDLATVEMGALIPHRPKDGAPTASNAESPSLADVLDVALLDRLLGAQEEKANALARARQTEDSLSALNERNEHALSELEVVRQEADLSADRLREERMARIVADAKVAELRDRVIREMTLADSEKQARVEATMRNIQAERDNANAYASMGWMARRRYRRLNRAQASRE